MTELVKSWHDSVPSSSESSPDSKNDGDLDIRDALRLAHKDQKFCTVFLASPETLDEVFRLSESQIAAIRDASESADSAEKAVQRLEGEYSDSMPADGGE